MKYIFFITLLFTLACKSESPQDEASAMVEQVEFNASGWNLQVEGKFPQRPSMVDDILHTDVIRKLDKDAALRLLGEADKVVEDYYYYTISQMSVGMWPIKTKTLVVKFTKTGSVEWIKLHG